MQDSLLVEQQTIQGNGKDYNRKIQQSSILDDKNQ
jgi:hypothetical protein